MFQQAIYKKLKLFSNEDGQVIQDLAKALDEDDILDVFDTNKEELAGTAEDSDDYTFFMMHWRKGRLDGKRKAVHSLMDGMKSPDVALSYLRQLTTSWPTEGVAGKGMINLKIGLDKFSAESSSNSSAE